MTEHEVPIVKDDKSERPIPTSWRPIITEIISAFAKQDYLLSKEIDGVAPVSQETADHIKGYIADYGEDLIQLPEETWDSSVYIWMGAHWDILVDLWTSGEGPSDLVLAAQVSENEGGYLVHVQMVYVP